LPYFVVLVFNANSQALLRRSISRRISRITRRITRRISRITRCITRRISRRISRISRRISRITRRICCRRYRISRRISGRLCYRFSLLATVTIKPPISGSTNGRRRNNRGCN
jgi:hypothetical protein